MYTGIRSYLIPVIRLVTKITNRLYLYCHLFIVGEYTLEDAIPKINRPAVSKRFPTRRVETLGYYSSSYL